MQTFVLLDNIPLHVVTLQIGFNQLGMHVQSSGVLQAPLAVHTCGSVVFFPKQLAYSQILPDHPVGQTQLCGETQEPLPEQTVDVSELTPKQTGTLQLPKTQLPLGWQTQVSVAVQMPWLVQTAGFVALMPKQMGI